MTSVLFIIVAVLSIIAAQLNAIRCHRTRFTTGEAFAITFAVAACFTLAYLAALGLHWRIL